MTQMVKKSDCFVQTSKKMSIPVQDQNLAQQLACEHSTFNIIDFAKMDVGQPFQSWKCKEGSGKIVEQFKLRFPSLTQMERQTKTSRPYGFQAGNREVILAMSFPECYIALDCKWVVTFGCVR